jgi:ribonuclease HI
MAKSHGKVTWAAGAPAGACTYRRRRGDNVYEEAVVEGDYRYVGGGVPTSKSGSVLDLLFVGAGVRSDECRSYVLDGFAIGRHYPLLYVVGGVDAPEARRARNIYDESKSRGPFVEALETMSADWGEISEEAMEGLGGEEVEELCRQLVRLIMDASARTIKRTDKKSRIHDTTDGKWAGVGAKKGKQKNQGAGVPAPTIAERAAAGEYKGKELRRIRNRHFRKQVDGCKPRDVYRIARMVEPGHTLPRSYCGGKRPQVLAEELARDCHHPTPAERLPGWIAEDIKQAQWVRDHVAGAEWAPWSEHEVRAALGSLDAAARGGVDGMDATQLIWAADSPAVVRMFTRLANRVIRTGRNPVGWKRALVRPVPKPAGGFRPISLLCVLDKTIQTLVSRRLYDHVGSKLASSQYGFQLRKSAEMALMEIAERSFRAASSSPRISRGFSTPTTGSSTQRAALVSFDFRKAFDKTDRSRLMGRVIEAGVDPFLVRYISDFLAGRSYVVEMRTYQGLCRGSQWRNPSGVVQGSVLGPLLFLIHVNGLITEVRRHCAHFGAEIMYADDLTVVVTGRDMPELTSNLRKLMGVVESWSQREWQPLNEGKTKAILLGGKRRGESMPEVTGMQFVKEHRILGLLFDEGLDFNAHARNVLQRAQNRMKGLNFLAGQAWGPSPSTLRAAFRGYVESLVRYGLGIWYQRASVKSLQAIQVVLNTGYRKITGLDKTAGTVMAQHLSKCYNLDELYDVYAVAETDRALRVRNSSLRTLIIDDAVPNPQCGFVHPLLSKLDAQFPRGDCVRRFFPEKRGWKELFSSHGNVRVLLDPADRVKSQEAADMLEQDAASVVVYTDGSVTLPRQLGNPENRAGAAWMVRDCAAGVEVLESENCGKYQHVYGVERRALTRGAEAARNYIGHSDRHSRPGETKVVMISDCLSLLQKVDSQSIEEEEDVELHRAIGLLAENSVVELRHVTSHIGISGNETVDTEAKAAARGVCVTGGSSLLHSVVKSESKRLARVKRVAVLDEVAEAKPRYGLARRLQGEEWRNGIMDEEWEREDGRLLAQVLAMHCPRIAGCAPRRDLDEHARCRWCGESRERNPHFSHVFHHLFECEKLTESRSRWLGTLQAIENRKDDPSTIILCPESAFKEMTPAVEYVRETLRERKKEEDEEEEEEEEEPGAE